VGTSGTSATVGTSAERTPCAITTSAKTSAGGKLLIFNGLRGGPRKLLILNRLQKQLTPTLTLKTHI